MPVLVLAVAKDFNKLLENGRLAAITFLCKLGRVVIVAVDLTIVFIVAILRAKDGRAHGTRKVIDVIFVVESGNIGAAQGPVTLMTDEIESTKIVGLAERILISRSVLLVDGKELGGDRSTTILSHLV